MFQPVSPKPDFKTLEEDTLKFWRERGIFRKSVTARKGAKPYIFFEGPSTANAIPGIQQVLTRALKDLFPRYKTMTGRYVLRRGGWGTHGLAVELEVERQLGLADKKQIEEYGIAHFNAKCRQSAFDYIREWERLIDRLAFWVDLQDAYVTFTNDYIESVWWLLRQLWEKDLVYQGFKVVPYCPRCGTVLSEPEAALGHEDDTPDPSAFVRFPFAGEADTSLLVWTTAPWTLLANAALAVHPDASYAKLRHQMDETGLDEYLILARDQVDTVMGDANFDVVETFTGSQLRGKRYQPLFTFLPPDRDSFYVVAADFVTAARGTGIVHLAPAYGAEDLQMADDYNLPVLMPLDSEGQFIEAITPWRGKFFKEADPLIMRDLELRGLVFKSDTRHHASPHCWRCHTPLLYSARNTWYIATSRLQGHLATLSEAIQWHPEHRPEERLEGRLARNADWVLGRDRFWGTPLPLWLCDRCGHLHCVGSVQQLADLSHKDQSQLDLHRPHIDEISFACPECKDGTMYRVPEVIDAGFDSGSMPVAQWHYPFENQGTFREQFPADFICEASDQTSGWFYTLHVISAMLFDCPAYKNVVCPGWLLDAEGRKISKSLGNIVNPWDVLDAHGADALRWYLYTAAPLDQDCRLSADLVGEVVRSFMLPLWNAYGFFVTYANLDRWKPVANGVWGPAEGQSLLDRWILSELHLLVRGVGAAYERYDAAGATRPIERFAADLSHWYLRRSRRRFWKSGASADKHAAYTTLHLCLTTVAKLLAPAMPLLAETLYRNLVLSVDPAQPESVHLAGWPTYDPAWIDERLNADMRLVLKLVALGHGARDKASRKVRQPLAEAAFAVSTADEARVVTDYAGLIADELNVQSVRVLESAGEAAAYSLHPLPAPLGQKHGAQYPKVEAALLKLDPEAAARAILAGRGVTISVDGQAIVVLPEEVEVRLNPKEGLAIMSEGRYLAAVRTALTPDLVQEGLARDFVRHAQDLRKTAGFDLADRILIYYAATPLLAKAIATYADHIQAETLSAELIAGAPPEGAATAEAAFEGESVKLGIVKM